MRNARNHDRIRTYSKDAALVKAKRKEIINKAARVFLRKGYHKTNMREIAAACNMSVGSIYNYIGSKQDILFLIIDNAIEWSGEIKNQLDTLLDEKGAVEVFRLFIDEYYRIVDRDRANIMFIYRETTNLDMHFRQSVIDSSVLDLEILKKILARGIETGVFQIDNPALIAHNLLALAHMWAVRGYLLKNICTLDEYIKEQTTSVLERIMVKKGTTPAAKH